jgi:exodeoxyribonuclease VII large subunit
VSDLFDLPFEEPGPAPPAPVRRIYTVSELNAEIRTRLETAYSAIWVEGEISNSRRWTTGHLYFTLKDGSAQLKAVMFRTELRYLRFKPDDGLHVIARGRVSVYDAKGEYQIICEHLEPHGLGALQLAFDQLKKRLAAEGLFDSRRKRPLPALPRKIGVVTSLDGAALRDILKVLGRRYPDAHVIVRPCRVQGEGAAADVVKSLAAIGRVPGVDVVIVGRGGGSIEDLWAFNEEAVARAIAAVPVPVIAAVGHEVDVTIADFVADVRAPTPSAAAEMVVSRKDDFYGRIDRLADRATAAVRSRLQRLASRVHALERRPGFAGWRARVAMAGRHAAELTHDVRRLALASIARKERQHQGLRLRLEALDLRRRLAGNRAKLASADARLRGAVARAHLREQARARTLAARLDGLSPLAVLGRGYAVCWNDERTAIVRDAASVAAGTRVRVTLHRGELRCEVRETDTRRDARESS